MLDYLIVGYGLAGLSFSTQLRKHNKSFVVISESHNSSSVVAGGMYNPVILKRFTAPWNALAQLEYAIPFYQEIEASLAIKVLSPLAVLRVFNSIEEQNNWLISSDKANLAPFLSVDFIANTNVNINATHKFGLVKNAGRLQVAKLLKANAAHLKQQNSFVDVCFNYDALTIHDSYFEYKDITAKHIVFCEGFGLKSNPYFNYLPLNGTKGEVLIIKSKALQLESIVKSGVFIIPLEDEHTYLIGATYQWDDKTWRTTEMAKKQLIAKLESVLLCDYKIIDQLAGIRPTVNDRRPLVGRHPKHNNMYVLNGLGTRGVMVAPMLSGQLFNYIENNELLASEIDIQRFVTAYEND